MPVTLQNEEQSCRLKLEGEITLTCAAELKERLTEALALAKGIQVDLAQVTEMDITPIQLLCAAEREALRTSVPFRLVEQAPLSIRNTLHGAGFEQFAGGLFTE